MKYQEDLYIERPEGDLEVIRLHDLNLEIVYDYRADEHQLQLRDLQNQSLITTIPYGDGCTLEGFSFAVSPRHNYLIVKECTEGMSLDDLYATLYCLRDIRAEPPRNPSELGELEVPRFHSYYHLTFHFSGDEDESSFLLRGQQCAELAVIDEYLFGDYEVQDGDNHKRLARFYKVASFPDVALDARLRDLRYHKRLAASEVVNDLATVERGKRSDSAQLTLPHDYTALLQAQLSALGGAGKHLLHTVLADANTDPNIEGFTRELQGMGLDYATAAKAQISCVSIALPIVAEASHSAVLSIKLLNELCPKYGLVYQGYRIGEALALSQWFDALTAVSEQYTFLADCFVKEIFDADTFYTQYLSLQRKHEDLALIEHFGRDFQAKLARIDRALSRFSDWEIKEPELRQVVLQCGLVSDTDLTP